MTWSDVAQIAQTLALLLIGAALVVLAVALGRFLHVLTRLEARLERWTDQTQPLVEVSRAIAEDLHAVARRMREEVERAGELARRAVEGLDGTLDSAGDRLSRLADLLELFQDELEEALIGGLSALRGIRVGWSALRSRRRRRDRVEDDE